MLNHIVCADDFSPLKLCHIGTSKDKSDTHFGPGRRDLYLIHYVVSGSGFFNGIRLSAGRGFLIKPGAPEYYYPDPRDPWEILWITSADKMMEKFFPLYQADESTQVFSFSPVSAVKSVIPLLINNNNCIYSSSQALELFLHIFNSHSSINPDLSEDKYFKIAANYISANIYKAVTVSELTDLLGVSQPYLYKVFKKKCGISPKKYINSARLEKAAGLLSATDLNISEISYSVGYDDPLSFSKFFKTHMGVSPQKYRLTGKQ